MKQIIFLVATLFNSFLAYSQIKSDFLTTVRELNLSYKDSLDGIVTPGYYESCGLLKINDSTLVIAANIWIHFKSLDNNLLNQNPDLYYKKLDTILNKEVDYGKTIEVNKDFNTNWGKSFNEKISKIELLKNNTFLVFGSNYKNQIWVDDLDVNGHMLWSKKYKVNKLSIFDDIKMDKSGNTYILVESHKNDLKKRFYNILKFEFFKKRDYDRNEFKTHLIKISPKGDKIFDKIISNKKYHGVDYSLIIDSSQTLFIQFGILYEYTKNGKYYENSWNTLNKYNKYGKIVDTSNQCANIIDNDYYAGNLSCYFKHDTFYISRWYFKKEIPIDSIEVNGPFSKEGAYEIKNPQIIKLKEKYLFICEASGRDLFCLLDKNLHFINYSFYEISGGYTEFINAILKNDGDVVILNKDTYNLPDRELEFTTKTHLLELKIKGQ